MLKPVSTRLYVNVTAPAVFAKVAEPPVFCPLAVATVCVNDTTVPPTAVIAPAVVLVEAVFETAEDKVDVPAVVVLPMVMVPVVSPVKVAEIFKPPVTLTD